MHPQHNDHGPDHDTVLPSISDQSEIASMNNRGTNGTTTTTTTNTSSSIDSIEHASEVNLRRGSSSYPHSTAQPRQQRTNPIIVVDTSKSAVGRLQKVKSSLFTLAKFLIFLFLSLHAIMVALNTFQYREVFSSSTVNTLCSRYPSSPDHSTNSAALEDSIGGQTISSFTHDQLQTSCDVLPPQRQFKKFIWFLTDGLPVKYSQKIFQHYSEHMVCGWHRFISSRCYIRSLIQSFHSQCDPRR